MIDQGLIELEKEWQDVIPIWAATIRAKNNSVKVGDVIYSRIWREECCVVAEVWGMTSDYTHPSYCEDCDQFASTIPKTNLGKTRGDIIDLVSVHQVSKFVKHVREKHKELIKRNA